MATKKKDCSRDKFFQRLDPKYGYFVKDYKNKRKKRMLAFLVIIFSPENAYNITLTLAPPCFLHTPRRKWWIGETSLENWYTSWQPTSSAANPLTLGLSSSTFTHTETYSLTKRKPNGYRISSCGSSRLPTQSRRWVTRVRTRKI